MYSDNVDLEKLGRIREKIENQEVTLEYLDYIAHFSSDDRMEGLIFDYIEENDFSNLEHYVNFTKLAKKDKVNTYDRFPRFFDGMCKIEGFLLAAIKSIVEENKE